MNGQCETSARRSRPAARSAATRRFATAICVVVLGLGHAGTGYLLLNAYLASPVGSWDSGSVSLSNIASGVALAVCAVTAALTWYFVKAGLLRKWWFALPALLAGAALLRWTVLAPTL
jgi:hypothetical protein